MTLEQYGWGDRVAQAFQPYVQQGYLAGRVTLAQRHQFRLHTEVGDIAATVSGKFIHDTTAAADFPVVGDWVVVQPLAEAANGSGQGVIHQVLPRYSQFARKAAGTRTEAQLLVANVDTALLISGLDGDFNPRRIERYLVQTWESGANPVIVLNKADQCDRVAEKIADLDAIALGVPILPISAEYGTGLEHLNPYLQPGQTLVLLGSSGVGKSTLTNQLLGQTVQPTQSVRQDDSRGRHTTTGRQLFHLPSGALLIDTPGMRELQLWSSETSLDSTYADIDALAQQCRFSDCRHQQEPGCAVQAAITADELAPDRLYSYQKLQKEQQYLARKSNPQEQQNSKKRWKTITKSMRHSKKSDY
ncbi:MAG: ribosome small subunit-dependent GTPase A [Cyanobacteria bacterium J06659_2]